jgi:hypothetical protein
MLIKIDDTITFGFKYACIKLAQVDIDVGWTKFTSMYLVISYVRHNKTTILVVEYDEQVLFPLLVECYKLLIPNVVENFQLQCSHMDFDMISFIKQRKQMLII